MERTLPQVNTCLYGGPLTRDTTAAGVQDAAVVRIIDQRQHRTLHIQKDVLPYTLC